ncbi:hypothetical protein AZZ82_000221 [Klebsiella aerogenes]|nr:hypothetical protein AZZ82_000221 [Klebsiella aerogenes]
MVNTLTAGRMSRRYCYRFATVLVREKHVLCVNLKPIALPIFLLRYGTHGAGSVQGAASRRRPLYPRALAAKIATSWYLRLIPAGFGSGRGSVRAKHGPQPASMRAAPTCRERLSDFEAANTGSFSQHGEYIKDRPHGPWILLSVCNFFKVFSRRRRAAPSPGY